MNTPLLRARRKKLVVYFKIATYFELLFSHRLAQNLWEKLYSYRILCISFTQPVDSL